MAAFRGKAVVIIFQLSFLLLTSISSFTVLGNEFDDIVSWMQLPQSLNSQPPAEPPKAHKGGHHHHHHHHKQPAPSPAPVKPPTPPAKSPTPPSKSPTPPAKSPTPPPPPPTKTPPPSPPPSYPVLRKLFAVQGVVYCKSCKFAGIDTLLGATPLVGAVVKLQCNNTKYKPAEATATTDKNGYFFLMPKNVTTAASHKCKASLVSSPSKTCNVPTNLHAGSSGAILMPEPTTPPAAAPVKPPVPSLPYQIFTVGPFAYEPSKKIPCPR